MPVAAQAWEKAAEQAVLSGQSLAERQAEAEVATVVAAPEHRLRPMLAMQLALRGRSQMEEQCNGGSFCTS